MPWLKQLAALGAAAVCCSWGLSQVPGAAAWAGPAPGRGVEAVLAPGPQLLVGYGSGLWTSSDGAKSWESRLPTTDRVSFAQFPSATVGFAWLAGGTAVRTTDSGRTWRPFPGGSPAGLISGQFWSSSDGVGVIAGAEGGPGRLAALWATYDGGHRWSPVKFPRGWSLHSPTLLDGLGTAPVCFSARGQGWVVATYLGRQGLLHSSDGGRNWQVVMTPGDLPSSGSLTLGACNGTSIWAVYQQQEGPMNMAGPPMTYDILHSSDAGRHWFDVLRTPAMSTSNGGYRVSRPRFPSPGPHPYVATTAAGSPLEAMFAPRQGTSWFDETDEGGLAMQVGATADGGRRWNVVSFSWNVSTVTHGAVPGQVLSLAPVDGKHAWMLIRPRTPSAPAELFSTADQGSTWSRSGLPG